MLDVRRREFITLLGGAAAAWPIVAGAQQNEQVRRMGVLMPFAMGNGEAQASSNILLQGLREFGWIEGRNLKVEYRFAGGGAEDLRTKGRRADHFANGCDRCSSHAYGYRACKSNYDDPHCVHGR